MNKKYLVCRWGYSMTLNDFVVIEKETAKTVTVRRVKSKIVEDTGYLAGREAPSEEYYEQDTKTYTLTKKGDVYRGRAFLSTPYTWYPVKEGETYYFNHCD